MVFILWVAMQASLLSSRFTQDLARTPAAQCPPGLLRELAAPPFSPETLCRAPPSPSTQLLGAGPTSNSTLDPSPSGCAVIRVSRL